MSRANAYNNNRNNNNNNNTNTNNDTSDEEYSDLEDEEEGEGEEERHDGDGLRIIVSELYNDLLHGSETINGHFLVQVAFPSFDVGRINSATRCIQERNEEISVRYRRHKTIRNYEELLRTGAFNAPQIAKCIRLPSGELVAIFKTVYLRIFQRKWKKYYREKRSRCKSLNNIWLSRLTGKRVWS